MDAGFVSLFLCVLLFFSLLIWSVRVAIISYSVHVTGLGDGDVVLINSNAMDHISLPNA